MHVFKNADDLYYAMLQHLYQSGGQHDSRDGAVHGEILGCAIGLQSIEQNFVMHERRDLSPVYASAELLWYLSRADNAKMLLHYAPSYQKYVCDNGYDYAAYGGRLAQNIRIDGTFVDQLELAVLMLKNQPLSRQVVVTLWKPEDLWHSHVKDVNAVPCTLTWQFIRRGDYLHMIASMRSCDAWLGLPYDMYAFTTIQRLVAGELGLQPATYAHFVGSMHLYQRDVKKALLLLEKGPLRAAHIHGVDGKMLGTPLTHEYHMVKGGLDGLMTALSIEEASRDSNWDRKYDFDVVKAANECGMSQVLMDAMMTCIAHNTGAPESFVHSPILRKAYHDSRSRKTRSS